MENFIPNVQIFGNNSKDPVLVNSLILAASSEYFEELLKLNNFCDGCKEDKCFILDGEDRETIKNVISYVKLDNVETFELNKVLINKMLGLANRLRLRLFVWEKLQKAIATDIMLNKPSNFVEKLIGKIDLSLTLKTKKYAFDRSC